MKNQEDFVRLGALTAPLSVPEFLQRRWPQEFHVSHAPAPALAPLLDQSELRNVQALCSAPRRGTLRVDYTREERVSEFDVPVERAVSLFAAGCTIYLTDLRTGQSRLWSKSLDATLGLIPGTATINAFTSMPGKGLAWHWDAQELFIVQVRGRKLWHVAPNHVVEWPTVNGSPQQDPARGELSFQVKNPAAPIAAPERWTSIEMRPGSVMFLPRGYWHRAENIDESLHLVLQVRMPCWRDVLRFILDNVPELYSPEWRCPTAALRPENLPTLAPAQFKERLASLTSFASPSGVMSLVDRFTRLAEDRGVSNLGNGDPY